MSQLPVRGGPCRDARHTLPQYVVRTCRPHVTSLPGEGRGKPVTCGIVEAREANRPTLKVTCAHQSVGTRVRNMTATELQQV